MLVDPTVAFKCSADETITTINATAALLGFSDEASLDVAPGAPYTFTIEPLRQSSAVDAGYGVRISALNSAGFGVLSDALVFKPEGVPDAPVLVALVRVAGSSTKLRRCAFTGRSCTGPRTAEDRSKRRAAAPPSGRMESPPTRGARSKTSSTLYRWPRDRTYSRCQRIRHRRRWG